MHGTAHIKYLVLSILFIFASVNFTRTTLEILKSSKRLDDLKNEVSALEDKRDGLTEDIAFKQTDDYIAEIARNDLNLIKPGEKVYVIQGDSLETDDSRVSSVLGDFSKTIEAQTGVKDTNAYQWYKLFFD